MNDEAAQTDTITEVPDTSDTASADMSLSDGQSSEATLATPDSADPSSLATETETPEDTSTDAALADATKAFDEAAERADDQPGAEETQAQPAKPELPPEIQRLLSNPDEIKRIVNLNKLHGQQANELGRLRKENEQYQRFGRPEEVAKQLAAREEMARQANLKPWNRDHPGHQKFATTRELWRRDMRRLDRVAPEQRDAVRQALMAEYSREEQQALQEYDDWRAQEESLSPEDRDDRQREIARQVTLATIQQWEQSQMQRMTARSVIDQHGEVLTRHVDDVERIMNPDTPRRDIAIENALLKEQIAQLTGKSVQDAKTVATAQARDRLTKSRAGVSRDGASVPHDIASEASKRSKNGEDPDALWDALTDLADQARNPHASR